MRDKTITPGPWHVGGTFDPDGPMPTCNVWNEAGPGAQSGIVVARGVRLADAALIASAPALAAELAKLREDYADCAAALDGMLTAFSLETEYNLKDSAVIRLEAKKSARAIISKAKGRAG